MLRFQSDPHFVKLHNSCLHANVVLRCFRTDAYQVVLLISRLLRYTVFLQDTANALAVHYIVSHAVVYLVVSRHQVGDPA